jgi:hypothetical protein
MIRLVWDRDGQELQAFGRIIPMWCRVRNELNGQRKPNQIATTIPEKLPYQPRVFPLGIWRVGVPIPKTDPYMEPAFIPTDAWQMVATWEVKDGCYDGPTGRKTRDEGYGLHYSTSYTTLGCGRIQYREDAVWLVEKIANAIRSGETVELEVV